METDLIHLLSVVSTPLEGLLSRNLSRAASRDTVARASAVSASLPVVTPTGFFLSGCCTFVGRN